MKSQLECPIWWEWTKCSRWCAISTFLFVCFVFKYFIFSIILMGWTRIWHLCAAQTSAKAQEENNKGPNNKMQMAKYKETRTKQVRSRQLETKRKMVTDHVSSDGSSTPSSEPESMAVDGCSSPVTFSDGQVTASSRLTSIFLLLHLLPIRHWLEIESVSLI